MDEKEYITMLELTLLQVKIGTITIAEAVYHVDRYAKEYYHMAEMPTEKVDIVVRRIICSPHVRLFEARLS